MARQFSAVMFLLISSVILCCVLYPLALLGIGATVFPDQAQGSIMTDAAGKTVGSRLIAQGFTGDEYFWPRPSAVSYNGAASGASNWGAANYRLRDRVARALGPIVKYRNGNPVAPDVEKWFQKDQFQGKPGIVAQWAETHSGLAQDWVKADKLNTEFVEAWQRQHPQEVAQWIKDNPTTPEPKPEDLAVPFFQSFAKAFPGQFPVLVEEKDKDGNVVKDKDDNVVKHVQVVKEGSDIQSIFFDLWRQEHADADLEPVPADLVMASGSGLDPHITMKNAQYQLDRVAGVWADKTKRDKGEVRKEIEKLLAQHRHPVFVGPVVVNVLEVNAALKARFAQ